MYKRKKTGKTLGLFSLLLLIMLLSPGESLAQADVTIGTAYHLNLQRKSDHADAFILHNAEYYDNADILQWTTTHPSFGSRGIRFSYMTGIHFYADKSAATAGINFTPTTRLFIKNDGKVGIGTVDPQSKLDVNGNIQISSAGLPMGLMAEVGGTTPLLNMSLNFREPNINENYLGAGFRIDSRANSSLFQWIFRAAGTSNDIQVMNLTREGKLGIGPDFGNTHPIANLEIRDDFPGMLMQADRTDGYSSVRFSESLNSWKGGFIKYDNGTDYLSVGVYNNETTTTGDDIEAITIGRPDGKVGIGTLPIENYQLAVNGTIGAKEVNVTIEGWADFVFKEGYELPTLDEVEKHIEKNKRLPGIPSAEEVKEDGVNLGGMDVLLLQKIEELTLYMIVLNKQVEEISKERSMLKKENDALKSKLDKVNKLEKALKDLLKEKK